MGDYFIVMYANYALLLSFVHCKEGAVFAILSYMSQQTEMLSPVHMILLGFGICGCWVASGKVRVCIITGLSKFLNGY